MTGIVRGFLINYDWSECNEKFGRRFGEIYGMQFYIGIWGAAVSSFKFYSNHCLRLIIKINFKGIPHILPTYTKVGQENFVNSAYLNMIIMSLTTQFKFSSSKMLVFKTT